MAYVGQSINIRARWIDHKKRLNRGNHYNSHLQNSWKKYGRDEFSFWIIHECDEVDLGKFEQEVAEYFRQGGVSLFNVGGYLPSPARGTKRPDNSRRLKEMHADPVLGPILRRGAIERARKLKGTEEARRIARHAIKIRLEKNPPKRKVKMSPEEKKRLRIDNAKRILAGRFKTVRPVVRVDDGKIFHSVKDAAICIGVTSAAVCDAIKNNRKIQGQKFEYAGQPVTVRSEFGVSGIKE